MEAVIMAVMANVLHKPSVLRWVTSNILPNGYIISIYYPLKVYKSECSTNYEEKCETTPVTTHKEVCHDVDEVKLNSQCYNKYYKECYADNRSNKDIKKGNKKSKRSPVGVLQAILLAQALSTRHPENEREEEERCIVFPRKICSQVPVKSVTKKCQQVKSILYKFNL